MYLAAGGRRIHYLGCTRSGRPRLPRMAAGQTGDTQTLPPLAEQRRIVAKLEDLLPLVDKLAISN